MSASEPTAGMIALIKWTCAASAACLAETMTMPLDVTKTRLQLQNELVTKTISDGMIVKPPSQGMIATATGIYVNEGFRSLFKGLTAGVLRQSLCAGIGIGLYPEVKSWVQNKRGGQEVTLPFKIVSASLCGVIGQTIASPTDVVKVRLQADAREGIQPRYRNTADAFFKIPQQEGVLALFRGIAPSLLRAIAMYGASVPTYDTVKKHIVTDIFDGDVIQGDRMIVHMTSSLCSGFVASVVSTPFDTVKTRIINQPSQSMKPEFARPAIPTSTPTLTPTATTTSTSLHHTPHATLSHSAATTTAPIPTHAHHIKPPHHTIPPSHSQPHHHITTMIHPLQSSTLSFTSQSHIPTPTPPTPSIPPQPPLYRGAWDCAIKTVRAEGLLGLYKGFIPTYTRLGPWQLVFFVAFEQLNIMVTGHSMR